MPVAMGGKLPLRPMPQLSIVLLEPENMTLINVGGHRPILREVIACSLLLRGPTILWALPLPPTPTFIRDKGEGQPDQLDLVLLLPLLISLLPPIDSRAPLPLLYHLPYHCL